MYFSVKTHSHSKIVNQAPDIYHAKYFAGVGDASAMTSDRVFDHSHRAIVSRVNPLRFLCNLPKTPKKGRPKVNCMLFLGHLDDMHGVGLL